MVKKMCIRENVNAVKVALVRADTELTKNETKKKSWLAVNIPIHYNQLMGLR